MDIMQELKPIGVLFTEGKYCECLEALTKLWGELPDPKHSVLNSYMVVAYGVNIAQKVNNLERAWEWAQRGLPYSGNVNLGGESEFLAAEVAFARGDKQTAKQYFKIAKKLSGKRFFRGKNPEYLDLAENKN